MSLTDRSRAVVGTFYRRLATNPMVAWWNDIGWFNASDQDSETYAMLGQVPAVRAWKGERQMAAIRADKITIYNDVFEASVRIPVEAYRRDKTGQYMARVQELADRAGWQHWHKLMSTLILNGTGETNGLAYDGQYFFDTDHSLGDSGTQKNLLTSSEVAALNIGTATAPTELEAAQAVLGTIDYMRTYVDDVGEPCNEDAMSFLVMSGSPAISSALESACYAATLYNGSGVAGPNQLKTRNTTLKFAHNTRLSSWTDKFAIFRTDGGVKPFILQEELAPTMQVLGEDSEFAKTTNDTMFGVKSSRGVGYGEWMYAALATFS